MIPDFSSESMKTRRKGIVVFPLLWRERRKGREGKGRGGEGRRGERRGEKEKGKARKKRTL
jgi:hypothetical protein